ncbi:MAG: BA14K family protein [Pseudolabrys sp.]
MPFIVYAAILIATIFSVSLEWDALVQPSQTTRRAMHAITEVHVPPAVQPATPAPAAAPKAVQTPPPAAPAPAQANAQQPPAVAPEQPVAAETPAPPQCDVDACTAAYRTFRASDCTYNSSTGRRLCTKDTAEALPEGANASVQPVPGCHIRACAEHYSSFNPTDCTYQPLDGPRRRCKK